MQYASRQVRLQLMPEGKRVRRISLYVDLSGTKTSTDALDGDLFPQILQMITLQSSEGLLWNLSGMETSRLQHHEAGRVVMDPTDIPGTGTTFDMKFQVDLTFRAERQLGVDDGSLPTAMFNEHSLELTFASSTVWGVGTLTVTAGNVRVIPEYVDGVGVPQISEVRYYDLASGKAMLEPGIIQSALLVQTDYSTLTIAELGLLGLVCDGRDMHPSNTMHEQLVTLYNQDAATQSGSPHELVINAARFMPLTWLNRAKGALTKQPLIEKKGEVSVISGSLTNPRLVVRMARLKSADKAASLAVKTGAPSDAVVYEPAVASKSELRADHETARRGGAPTTKARAAYAALPGKMRRSPTSTVAK
jgi:hypothetical protein